MSTSHTVSLERRGVIIDGERVQLLSGAIHYFRFHQDDWRARLEAARDMGLNCVETYFCWNLHEPRPGEYDFSGNLDFVSFIRTAQELGLYVIIRPGPFICSEWTLGGLPAWVTALPGVRVRLNNPVYMAAVRRYFGVLLPKLRELQYTHGGPILMAAVENEYGSYGQDHDYLRALRDIFLEEGIDIPLFTADGGDGVHYALGGSIPDEMPVALTFGINGNAEEKFRTTRCVRGESPDMCMEYWAGWFDRWGEPHKAVDNSLTAQNFERMVAMGASVNLYMFAGGTNFGFNNGAGGIEETEYTPIVTSYDYDAAITEDGKPSPKFFELQEIIRKYHPEAHFGVPAYDGWGRYDPVKLTEFAPLLENLDNLSVPHHSDHTDTMEECGQRQGFILYRTTLHGHPGIAKGAVRIIGLHDRAQLFVDGKQVAVMWRKDGWKAHTVEIPFTAPEMTLEVLVENTGYINFGPMVGRDPKGILHGITACFRYQMDYTVYPLPMEDISGVKFSPMPAVLPEEECPAFYRGALHISGAPRQSWLKFPGIRGVVWVNGFCIGRYWNIGPGNALYIPKGILKPGDNDITVLELQRLDAPELRFERSTTIA